MVFSSWFGSIAAFHKPPASTVSIVTVSPMVPPEQVRHVLHQPVDVDRLHLERMLAREGEQALHQRRGALGGLAGIGEPAAHALLAVEAAQREIEIADDRGEQIVEVVRDAAGEAADRLHLLRLPQCFLGRLAARDLLAQHSFAAASRRVRRSAIRQSAIIAAVAGRPKIRWRRHAARSVAARMSSMSTPAAT